MTIARALNFALDGTIPEWIQLLPAGPTIQGTDGRAWTLTDPADLITAFQRRSTPLVVDWEHSSEHRAPQGLEAPAAGWIHRLELRGGAVWGNVSWTPKAAQQIQAREYRFLSPVFMHEKDSGRIVRLSSVALTNQPNLAMTALNRVSHPGTPDRDPALLAAAQQTFSRLGSVRRKFATAEQFCNHLERARSG